MEIPADPNSIDPGQDYDIVYDSGLKPENPPSAKGRLLISLPLGNFPVGSHNSVFIRAEESQLALVESVEILDQDWIDPFERFVETVGSKALTTMLREEIEKIDLTPVFGVFSFFGVELRDPIHLRLGNSQTSRGLAVGLHEATVFDDGRPDSISFLTGADDYALQIDEAFLALFVRSIQTGEMVPRRYTLDGVPRDDGVLLLHDIQMFMRGDSLRFRAFIDWGGQSGLMIQASIRFLPRDDGALVLDLHDVVAHPVLGGLLGAIARIFNVLTFYFFDTLLAHILGKLLEAVLERGLGSTLDDFLEHGAVSFAFRSPIKNTTKAVRLAPSSVKFEPGRAVLAGRMDIVPAQLYD